jgi:hypothetical protein
MTPIRTWAQIIAVFLTGLCVGCKEKEDEFPIRDQYTLAKMILLLSMGLKLFFILLPKLNGNLKGLNLMILTSGSPEWLA